MFSNAELHYDEEMMFYYIYIERRYKGKNKSTVKLTWGKLAYVSLQLILSCMVMGFRSHDSKKERKGHVMIYTLLAQTKSSSKMTE